MSFGSFHFISCFSSAFNVTGNDPSQLCYLLVWWMPTQQPSTATVIDHRSSMCQKVLLFSHPLWCFVCYNVSNILEIPLKWFEFCQRRTVFLITNVLFNHINYNLELFVFLCMRMFCKHEKGNDSSLIIRDGCFICWALTLNSSFIRLKYTLKQCFFVENLWESLFYWARSENCWSKPFEKRSLEAQFGKSYLESVIWKI